MLLQSLVVRMNHSREKMGEERKMAKVMATISRSLHENGLETCQPSPSVYDFTCCNGAIGKHIHAYALDSAVHL